MDKLGQFQGGKEAEEGKSLVPDLWLQLNISVNMLKSPISAFEHMFPISKFLTHATT